MHAPAFFLTPRIFFVLFFLSLICFLDLFTGASAKPFCNERCMGLNHQCMIVSALAADFMM